MRETINDLRSQLDAALNRQFEKELGDSVQRIREAVAPYTRFVRVEREKLERLETELKAAEVEVGQLRTMIEDLEPANRQSKLRRNRRYSDGAG